MAFLVMNLEQMRTVLQVEHTRRALAVHALIVEYDALGQSDEAAVLVPELMTAADSPEAHVEVIWRAARCLLKTESPELRDPMRALALAERACEIVEPGPCRHVWHCREVLALAQRANGETETANVTLQRAIDVAPEREVAALRLRLRRD